MARFKSLTIISLLLASSLLHSEDNELQALLNEVTEISTKNKINIDYTPGIVSIIKGEDLQEMGILYLEADSYDMIPGFWRGLSRASMQFTKYIVMLNGMSLNTQLLGINVLPRISTKAIKRIEVIRGPSSALYGANAFTAIVNIVTYDDKNVVWMDHAWYSSENRVASVGALVNQQIGELKTGVRFQYNDTDGPDQFITQDSASVNGQHSYTPAKYDNGMKNYDFDMMLEYQNWKLKFAREYFSFAEGYGMSGVNLPPERDDDAFKESKDLFELSYTFAVDQWQIEALAGAMHYDIRGSNLYIAPLGTSDYLLDLHFEERDFYAGVEAKLNTDQHQLLVGGRYFYSRLYRADYATTFNPTTNEIYATPTDIGPALPDVSRRIQSLWVQDYYYLSDALSLVGNLRYDRVDDIHESAVSPRLALIYQYNDHHILKAQYAQAFMIPTFVLLYGDGSRSVFDGYSNLGLDKSHNYEFSHIYKQFDESLKTTLYYTDMHRLHTYSQAGSVTTEYNNAIQSSGVEVEYLKQYHPFMIKANVAYNFYNKMKYLGSTLYEEEILPFPKLLGNLVVTAPLGRFFSSTLWYHYKGQVEQYMTGQKFDAENLVNIAVTYAEESMDNRLKVTLSVSDIFDQESRMVPFPNSYKQDEMVLNQQKIGIQVSYDF